MRHLGEIAFPNYTTGEQFSAIQKKCTDYAAARALEDLARNGHVSTTTTVQAYVDECAEHIDSQRQGRQLMVLLGFLGAGAGAWLLWRYR